MSRKTTRGNPVMGDDIEEIRKSLDFMSGELTKVTELVSEVKQLKNMIKEKDKTIGDLERRVQDLEQYTRMEDVIISGLDVKPRSYARAAADGGNVSEDAGTGDLQTLEMQVLQFLEGRDIHLDANGISACYTLPRKDQKSKPAIIVRFVNRKHKTGLMMQAKKLKGTQVYLNEHLTKKNAEIAREARYLRKNSKIKATWTRNCKVLIRLNGLTPEEAKTVMAVTSSFPPRIPRGSTLPLAHPQPSVHYSVPSGRSLLSEYAASYKTKACPGYLKKRSH